MRFEFCYMLSKPRKVQKSKWENFEEIAFVRQHHTWRFGKLHDHVKNDGNKKKSQRARIED